MTGPMRALAVFYAVQLRLQTETPRPQLVLLGIIFRTLLWTYRRFKNINLLNLRIVTYIYPCRAFVPPAETVVISVVPLTSDVEI